MSELFNYFAMAKIWEATLSTCLFFFIFKSPESTAYCVWVTRWKRVFLFSEGLFWLTAWRSVADFFFFLSLFFFLTALILFDFIFMAAVKTFFCPFKAPLFFFLYFWPKGCFFFFACSNSFFLFCFLSSWLPRCWAACPWMHQPAHWWMLKSYSDLLYERLWARWATWENILSRRPLKLKWTRITCC